MGFGSAIGGMLGGLGSKLMPIPGVDGLNWVIFLVDYFHLKKEVVYQLIKLWDIHGVER